ncbi:GTP-binding protein [Streptomyces silvisoli]|uniref:GTP-binding protein n=1 Tax=Streptomyces silvisoli TaxID=3034235 RepID=A0ABT5ZEC7_9ACTN|nr:GTP-binding protein [Streptomyces silvisoli]MDF3288021.1 GTP-binding protein [Streptomyces silvisoli]
MLTGFLASLRPSPPTRRVDLQQALNATWFRADGGHRYDTTVISVGVDLPGELDQDRLNGWLGGLLSARGADIFRSKGIPPLRARPSRYVFEGAPHAVAWRVRP